MQNLAAVFHGTPVEDLCRAELWRYERNPLEAWDELLAHSNEDRVPNPKNIFRSKFHGFFYVAPAQDSFMLRMRVPGGVLTACQIRGLADMAEDWGAGRADLTIRANLQIREFQPRHLVPVLHRIADLGMSSRGSGADNIRNITASPITGPDRQALLDVRPFADGLAHYILNSHDLHGLPRKFNVAFDDGRTISAVADTNDIGFQAVRISEDRAGRQSFAWGYLLSRLPLRHHGPQAVHDRLRSDSAAARGVAVAAAMIRVFGEHGDRTDRKKARLKYLVDKWGVAKFLEETEKLLAFPLLRLAAASASRVDRSTVQDISAFTRSCSRVCRMWVSRCRWAVCQWRRCARSRT